MNHLCEVSQLTSLSPLVCVWWKEQYTVSIPKKPHYVCVQEVRIAAKSFHVAQCLKGVHGWREQDKYCKRTFTLSKCCSLSDPWCCFLFHSLKGQLPVTLNKLCSHCPQLGSSAPPPPPFVSSPLESSFTARLPAEMPDAKFMLFLFGWFVSQGNAESPFKSNVFLIQAY